MKSMDLQPAFLAYDRKEPGALLSEALGGMQRHQKDAVFMLTVLYGDAS